MSVILNGYVCPAEFDRRKRKFKTDGILATRIQMEGYCRKCPAVACKPLLVSIIKK